MGKTKGKKFFTKQRLFRAAVMSLVFLTYMFILSITVQKVTLIGLVVVMLSCVVLDKVVLILLRRARVKKQAYKEGLE